MESVKAFNKYSRSESVYSYVGIVHSDKYYYISRRTMNVIVLMTWPLTLTLCAIGFWGFTCCKMMVYYAQCGTAYSYWNGSEFFVGGQLVR